MSVNDINSGSVIQDLGLGQQTQTAKDRNSLGQTEFLDLMVAQLKNQDPLQPMQNGDFIAQMAQFSSVSGLNKLQSSFDTLANSLQSNQALQASTLVGRSVLVPSGQAVLNQTGNVKGLLDLQQSSPNVTLSVMDGNGELVKTMQLGGHASGDVPFTWDGTNNAGEKMPYGKYTLVADAQGPDSRFSVGTLVNASVESVTIGNGGQQLTLNLQELGQVSFSQVREIK
jgi:flagellar basal-body rod modification protein FlgD